MNRETIESIIKNLIEQTISSSLEWKIGSTNTEVRRGYISSSDDKKTKFEADMNLKTDFSFRSLDLWIYNKDLVNGQLYLSSMEYPTIDNLGHIIYDKYIKPTITNTKKQDEALDNILGSLSKEVVRNSKIDKIINAFKWKI
jgi:hypothetical protein